MFIQSEEVVLYMQILSINIKVNLDVFPKISGCFKFICLFEYLFILVNRKHKTRLCSSPSKFSRDEHVTLSRTE